MRPNFQAKVGIGFAIAWLLVSCSEQPADKSEFTDAQRDEIGDIAGDAAGDSIADDETILELEKRLDEKNSEIQELEERLDEIEQRLKM